ncbi:MAG: hypothetical protein ABIP51_05415 [Bacteroidia bacterium]
MKKLILVFATIGLISMAATTKLYLSKDKAIVKNELKSEKYKACIDACNTCIASCKKVEKTCSANSSKMAECEKLCKECVTACTKAVKCMKSDSKDTKNECTECAKVCEKCVTECDKYDMTDCKKCATNCRVAAKHCSEM